jgi:hypothetical protein
MGYLIAFRGLNGEIDNQSVSMIARAERRTLHYFSYFDWQGAAGLIRRFPDDYWVLGFSVGGNAATLHPFMSKLREIKATLPTKIITVGLFDKSRRYEDGSVPVINYLDSTGQEHRHDPHCINLGPRVDHLGRNGGMAMVAKLLTEPPGSPR